MNKDVITFIKQKDFKFIKELGQGGLGKTVLVLDQEMAEQFVCKKYSPYDDSIKDEYYSYFKNEIKMMFQVNHQNVVRIFNYYLYPEYKTGYILMEYVDGNCIYDFLKENPAKIDYVFEQIIDAFLYLENHQILHRDIRSENILVNTEGQVKVIDFGFGKKIEVAEDAQKSISLNWWCEKPNDFLAGAYNHCTELYFIGKLFERILTDGIEDGIYFEFKYKVILENMVKIEPSDRYISFTQIKEHLIEYGTSFDELFTSQERRSYKAFAEKLISSLASIDENAKYITDVSRVISDLENAYKINVLEDEVQNTNGIIGAFLSGSYRFYNKPIFGCYVLRDFLQLLKRAGQEKKAIIMLNIQNRLNQVKRTEKAGYDDIPF